MNYKNILKEINLIKSNRSDFISQFDIEYDTVYDSLIEAVSDNCINSIRVHKYLTSNKKLPKVSTARFLESIDLNENTKILELNKSNISNIAEFSSRNDNYI